MTSDERSLTVQGGGTTQLLQEVPQSLLELAWLQLEPLVSAIASAARLKEHGATISPLNSKVVIAAYTHHEGTRRVETHQKDLADYGLQVLLLTRVKTKTKQQKLFQKGYKVFVIQVMKQP